MWFVIGPVPQFCTKTVIEVCQEWVLTMETIMMMMLNGLISSCFALQMQLEDIRAANAVNLNLRRANWRRRKTTASASDHSDLGEVLATQNIIISSLFYLFLSNYYFFFISFRCQKTSKSCLKLKRCVSLKNRLKLNHLDCIDFYE